MFEGIKKFASDLVDATLAFVFNLVEFIKFVCAERGVIPAILFSAAMLIGSLSSAATFYVVDGKFVEAGDAEEAKRNDPSKTIIKIQASEVQINKKTGNFKKSDDVSLEQLKSILK